MTRPYTQTRRAESQEATRRRIVEAAVDLHGTIGPVATTTSLIAERAGVQRHTVYAHFPDEQAMLTACSGHVFERDPLPPAGDWAELDAEARRCACLMTLYDWYARNAQLTACVMRDAEHHAGTRAAMELRMGETMAGYGALGEGLTHEGQALWGLALSFWTWRSLAEAGLSQTAAVEAMLKAALAV